MNIFSESALFELRTCGIERLDDYKQLKSKFYIGIEKKSFSLCPIFDFFRNFLKKKLKSKKKIEKNNFTIFDLKFDFDARRAELSTVL